MKRLLLSTLVLALSGCALMAPSTPPVAEIDAGKLGLSAQQAAWPDAQWWRRYGDAQLDRLVDEALAGSPTLTAAQARLAQANAAVRGARAPLTPTVDANYQLTRERLPEAYIYRAPMGGSAYTDNRLALDISYEIDFWGKNRSLLNAAVSERDAASADAQAARNLLAHSVVRSYLNLQNAMAQHRVLEEILKQRTDVAALTRDRQRNGLDTMVEVKQAESAVAAVRVSLTQEETTIAQLRNQAAALVGAGPDRGRAITAAQLTVPAGVLPENVPLELLGHRPDVTAARWRAEAARSRIEAAKADFFPNVNLAAFVGFQSLGVNNLFDGGYTWGVGPAVTLPVFHGGALNAQLAGRRAEADVAVADYNQAVLDAVHQTADALDALRLIEREKREQRQARLAIEDAYSLAVQRYKAGLGNYLTVLIAQNSVLDQDRLDTDVQMRAYQLDADLAYALGGGYQDTATATADTTSK
jgi:NodT family efflux transporter outer membrane factor (OMF) lipoprotein